MRAHRPHAQPPLALVAGTLAALGHEVTVLTTGLDGERGHIDTDGPFTVQYLGQTRPMVLTPAYWRSSAETFDRMHAERPFDVILGRGAATWGFHAHSRFAGRVPTVLHEGTYPRWLHNLDTRLGVVARGISPVGAVLQRWKHRHLATCMLSARRVVGVSAGLAGALRRAYWWAPLRTTVIPYAIQSVRGAVAAAAGESAPRLVSVGRMVPNKGILAMIDVLARQPRRDVTLEAFGPCTPDIRQRVLDHAAQRGVADRYAAPGAIRNEEVIDRISGATAFLFPTTHPEGLSKVVLEAMAAGVPVVAYRLAALENVVEDGVTGFLVPMRSVSAMAERVAQLVSDPDLVARMGTAARQKVATDFTQGRVAAQWQALLAEVVAEAPPGTRDGLG